MTKAGIYVRVSTAEQAKEGISISAQIERCRAFCNARGWEIFKIYKDAGYSAGNMDRPALRQLLQDSKEKKFDVLLVYKIDRFSRKLRDLIMVLEDLKKYGINFTSVTEQIDTTTAMGEAFFQIIGVFAQLEREMVRERVEVVFNKKVDSGEAVYRPPFGYRFKNRRLVPEPEEARIVKQIFEMWAAGIDYKDIVSEFGIPVSTLYQILRNPIYVGKIRYRGKLYNGRHKQIVPQELFDKAQSLLKHKKQDT